MQQQAAHASAACCSLARGLSCGRSMLVLPVLLQALGLLLAASSAAAANVTITGISPREASILGGTQITLTGSGFSATASSRPRASGGSALCRMGWNWGGWAFNSTTPPFPLPVPTTQATVLSDTELRCHTPAIANAGLVSVQVSLDGGTSWAGEGVHDQPHLRFFAPFSAAVHRRPYTDEADVRLLLNIHRSVTTRGESLQVSAAHEGKEVLAPTAVIAGRSSNTSFAAALLPAHVNGILNVTAKDLGTGKEQKITVTADSGLSDGEIDRMVNEAEAHADEDKKSREAAETRNQADALIYNTEKQLEEHADKLPEELKGTLTSQVEELKAARDASDIDRMQTVMQELQKQVSEIYKNIAQQAGVDPEAAGAGFPGAEGFPGGAADGAADSDESEVHEAEVVDAEYDMVDEDEDKDKK